VNRLLFGDILHDGHQRLAGEDADRDVRVLLEDEPLVLATRLERTRVRIADDHLDVPTVDPAGVPQFVGGDRAPRTIDRPMKSLSGFGARTPIVIGSSLPDPPVIEPTVPRQPAVESVAALPAVART